VLIVAIGTGVLVWRGVGGGSAAAAAATTQVITVSTQTLQQTVSTSGTMAPATESDLSFAVSGTVTAVRAVVGAKVAKGAVLATVDPTDLTSAVSAAQATLDGANAQLTAAAGGTDVQLAAAQAQVASATSKLAAAKQSLADATLTSPIAGTVAEVNVATGDVLSGSAGTGSSSGSASATSGTGASGSGGGGTGSSGSSTSSSSSTSSTAQVVVVSTSSWIVNATVGSADLASVKKGLQATITPTDTTSRIFGVVSSVGIVASTSSGAAAFPVVIAVTGSPTGLYVNGTATVSIVVKQVANALTVPTAAVSTAGGKSVVTLRSGTKDTQTPVTIGGVYGANTQILSGVKAGDQVVEKLVARTGGGTGTQTRQRTGTTGGEGFGGGAGGGGGGFGGGGAGFGGGGGAGFGGGTGGGNG
jgi:multidrug efflux pump subunit AcrA (membrane-fusion protein)